MFEKIKPHRARIFFLKIGKNVSKMVRSAQNFSLSLTMAQVELAHKKWAKSDENWQFDYKTKFGVRKI